MSFSSAESSDDESLVNPLASDDESVVNPMTSDDESVVNPMMSDDESVVNPMTSGDDSVVNPMTSGDDSVDIHLQSDFESSEELSDERLNNCASNSGQNESIKRRCIVSSEEDTSDDDFLQTPRPRKVIKQCNGSLSEKDSLGNEKDVESIIVQNCRHCCSICDEEYNHTRRRPLCLPCGHTFCLGCLGGIENTGSRLCPVCRGDFGVDMVARLQPCYQLIPGYDLLVPVMRPINVVQKTQKLEEGSVWKIKCLNQLLEVEQALNSSSVRPKEVAISVDRDSGVPLPQMKLFLDLLRRTSCDVGIELNDSFFEPNKLQQERDEQILKGLLNGRCILVKFRSYLSRNIFRHLEILRSLQSLGFGLIDSSDVRAIISALDKRFMDDVKTIHISISKHMKLNSIIRKIHVSADMKCVVHFCEVDDEYVKEIPKALDALFTPNSSITLQLHRAQFSLRGADALLGFMRDLGLTRAVVESFLLNPEEKKIMEDRCSKFMCRMTWT